MRWNRRGQNPSAVISPTGWSAGGTRTVIYRLLSRSLFDHVIRAQEQRLRDREAERSRRLQIDHQLERRRLLDGEVRRLCALEDLIDEGRGLAELFTDACSVRNEAAGLHVFTRGIDHRQPVFRRQRRGLLPEHEHERIDHPKGGGGSGLRRCLEGFLQIALGTYFLYRIELHPEPAGCGLCA